MMMTATITIPTTHWTLLAGGLFLAGLLVSAWSYRRPARRGGIYLLAWGCRILAILILAACLVEPLWLGRIAVPGENFLVVLVDNSASMDVRPADGRQGRAAQVKAALTGPDNGWLDRLNEHFQVRQYLFDERLERTDDLARLDYRGRSSLLHHSLEVIARRFRDRPLAGILLFSDGNATDDRESAAPDDSLPPVYPVLIDRAGGLRDLALTQVTVNQTAFETAPVTIQAEVSAAGCEGETIRLDLRDEETTLLESQSRTVDRDPQKHTIRFRLRPQKSGTTFYHVQAAFEQKGQPDESRSAEATLANNARTVVVNRPDAPYRILYVSGRPNWEYKFLQRALAEDEQIDLVALLRVARREPRYEWLGRRGETSNPLYRGFDRQDAEQTEPFDQPVLIRLNTRDEKELADGFPRTAEQLFAYHGLILDDVDAAFFTHDQMDLIRRFVGERGGGFLMLGGKESFRQGQFDRTPIAPVLPVYLAGAIPAGSLGPLRWELTREGWLQPWARLCENEQAERQRLEEMPPFRVLNRTGSVKAGAGVIATTGNDATQNLAVLAVQRYGNGRSAAVTIGDIWRWGLQNDETREQMNRFWRQTLRWLVADVPGRFTIWARPQPDQIRQPVEFQVRALDERHQPLDNLLVRIELDDSQGRSLHLRAQPVLNESG
ncbi:MAG: hypothetical protein JW810_09645, partial [Sedimentisphaerales bacterium]|nr:hypothetical protein [Sedimentisphaerales bacterium]